MEEEILFYTRASSDRSDDNCYYYSIKHAIPNDTCPIRPNTEIMKPNLNDLIDSLTYRYWEKYMLLNMKFDDSLSEKEIRHIKTVYNEFYLELNPDAILIRPISNDPETAAKIAQLYMSNHIKGKSSIDLFCLDDLELEPGTTSLVRFGIACEAGQSVWLMAKSDISKTPFRMSSGVNIIEKAYRGELMTYVDNIELPAYSHLYDGKFKINGALAQPLKIRFLDSDGALSPIQPEQPKKELIALFQLALPDLREIRPVVTTFLRD